MNRLPALCAVMAAVATLAGCATSATPDYDLRFGDAVRSARAQQILNPAASANPDRVLGMDGAAARDAVILYQDSFKTPPPVVNVINIGGATGGGGR